MSEESVETEKPEKKPVNGCLVSIVVFVFAMYLYFSIPSSLFSSQPFRMPDGQFNYGVEQKVSSVLIRADLGYIMGMKRLASDKKEYRIEVDSLKKRNLIFIYDTNWALVEVQDKSGRPIFTP